MTDPHEAITGEMISLFREDFIRLQQEIGKVMVGYQSIIEEVLIAFFAGGHILLEGLPGLGKTILVKTLAEAMDIKFSRIQFTPDLMPSDITGTNLIVESTSGQRGFQFQEGPIFAHLVLADEINRASPKTQSALLECMQEKSVTVAGHIHRLEEPFFLLATQNPIEMAGIYPLPEAQLDRFFFKLVLPYPTREQINEILNRTTQQIYPAVNKVLDKGKIQRWQQWVRGVYIAPHVQDYASRLVLATHPEGDGVLHNVKKYVRYGASPRAAQTLVLAAKIRALVAGRSHVSFGDIAPCAKPALRHRILLRLEAEAEGISTDVLLDRLLQDVAVER
jgi:MoxR-like ATPase